jgi:hypothetical protein
MGWKWSGWCGNLWERLDEGCAERLTPSLLTTAKQVARCGVLHLTAEIEAQVATSRRATGGRLLRKPRSHHVRLPRKGSERAHQATQGVPMKRLAWDRQEQGHGEVEKVASSWREPRRTLRPSRWWMERRAGVNGWSCWDGGKRPGKPLLASCWPSFPLR